MRVNANNDSPPGQLQSAAVSSRSANLDGRIRPLIRQGFGFSDDECSAELTAERLEKKFEQLSTLQKLQLARRLGYDSFGSMLAASTVLTLSDGSAWWLTADRNGAQTAWNLCRIECPQQDRANDEASVCCQPPL